MSTLAPRHAYPLLQCNRAQAVKGVLPLQICRDSDPASQDFVTFDFRLDTGADFSILSVNDAGRIGIPVPQESQVVAMNRAVGKITRVIHSSVLRVRLSDLGTDAFDWPFIFVEGEQPPVLGMAGVFTNQSDRVRVTIDGTSTNDFPFGCMIIERLRT